MLGSVVLDVAIGMAFVYLLLSLIATVVQEILATFMQLRSANLERALRSLFSGDKIGSGLDLVESIYDHGLVRGLYQDPAMDQKMPEHRNAARAAQDAQAAQELVESLQQACVVARQDDDPKAPQLEAALTCAESALETAKKDAENALAEVMKLNSRPLDPLRRWLRTWTGLSSGKQMSPMVVSNPILLPAYIPSSTFAQALIDTLNDDKLAGDAAMESITQMLREHHWQFRDNMATEALLSLALRSEGKLAAFQTNLETWYGSGMDRASGWYKRHTQNMLLVLGLILAIACNVDSIKVARTLWIDRDTRVGMVNAASDYTKNHETLPQSQPGTPFNAADLKQHMSDTVQQFNAVADQNLLPVGWRKAPWWTFRQKPTWRERRSYIWDKLTHGSTWALLLGWCLTAAAISLGAPFWFDTLNRFMVVRGTVKPAEKSKEEPSKA